MQGRRHHYLLVTFTLSISGLVNLDRPDKLLHKIARNVKYELGELQFSLKTETLCAAAIGNKVNQMVALHFDALL